MKTYIELFDDFKSTVEYVKRISDLKLNNEELRELLVRMARVHNLNLSESEIQTILQNLRN